jgi:hypothetical protein
MRVDIARHIFRPHTLGPSAGQNYLFDSAHQSIRSLTANHLFRRLPIAHRICRVYAETKEHAGPLATALDSLLGGTADDVTNM